jgi:hypothetical protein
MNEERARQMASEYIARELQRWATVELAISAIKEFDTCWIVLYNSRRYIETGEDDFKIIGNAPLIINKRTRIIRAGVTRLRPEAQVDET